MRLRFIAVTLTLFSCLAAGAQKISVSTNILDYAAFGTLNAEASVAVSRHWSLVAGAKYNPFTFNESDLEEQFQYRQQTYSVGVRLWPWHIWTGWWFSSALRYQEYNMGGLLSREVQEGDRFGIGFYSGYTHMLSSHVNLEFGLGLWGGWDKYTRYDCPACGLTSDSGNKVFLLPDELKISIAYVF